MEAGMITKGYKQNFTTLVAAAKADDLMLMECTDAKTGDPVMVVCAVYAVGKGDAREIRTVPLAKMVTGNPFEELLPPNLTA
jgi:hypothetical protein